MKLWIAHLQRVDDNNPDTRGQVVLLHDSGGDRAATVAALPELIRQTARARISLSCPFLSWPGFQEIR